MSDLGIDYASLVRHAPPTWVFKQDRHTRVWQIDTPAGPAVVKRYTHLPAWQMVQTLLRIHPGQHEVARTRELQGKLIAVAPILASGKQWSAAGCTFWLVMPQLGKDLREAIRQGDLEEAKYRRQVIDAVGALTVSLIQSGYANPQLRAEHVALDPAGQLWLLHARHVTHARGRVNTIRMLAVLMRSLTAEGISRAECSHLLRAIHRRCDFLGPLAALAREIDAVKVE